jgi:hypothetical protein
MISAPRWVLDTMSSLCCLEHPPHVMSTSRFLSLSSSVRLSENAVQSLPLSETPYGCGRRESMANIRALLWSALAGLLR